ncbi:hypothetical protein evm_009640 [Chilo suppressalis]|nr:hypothetical protein evm_009640 [Chilo suppressalis]
MNGEIFQPQSDRQKQILSKQASRIKALLLAFMVSSQFTCSLWAMKPLFDDVGSRKFPFDMWMPVSPEASPHYEIGYAIQVLTIGMSAYMYFGVDSVALSMLIFACAQCEIIMDKIMSVTSINYAMKNKERQKIFAKNRKKLIDCVKHHEALYAFTKLSEDAYHSYLFFQISGNVGIFCMTALRLTVGGQLPPPPCPYLRTPMPYHSQARQSAGFVAGDKSACEFIGECGSRLGAALAVQRRERRAAPHPRRTNPKTGDSCRKTVEQEKFQKNRRSPVKSGDLATLLVSHL